MSSIDRRSFGLLLIASVVGTTASLFAGHGHNFICCPECDQKVCEVSPTVIKDKKVAYSCECKDICIPGIKRPFASCDEMPGCGRVRTIKVLKKTEYECARCGYKWSVVSAGSNCCK